METQSCILTWEISLKKVGFSSQNQFYFSSYLLNIDNTVIVSNMAGKCQTEKTIS